MCDSSDALRKYSAASFAAGTNYAQNLCDVFMQQTHFPRHVRFHFASEFWTMVGAGELAGR